MYKDRKAAGIRLAEELGRRNFGTVSLLAIPRGGIIVAGPVADRLGTRIEVLVSRKIGHPNHPEVAIGAVMADGSAILNEKMIDLLGISPKYIQKKIVSEYEELQRQLVVYTGSNKPPVVGGKTVIVVDDGIATGYTLQAALKWLRSLAVAKVIIAVPIASWEAAMDLGEVADEFICPIQPSSFVSVGAYYENFSQTSDEEVLNTLEKANYSML